MTKKITQLSLLIAMAIILGYVENLIPFNLGIPGAKIGLANTITIIALYRYDFKSALIVSLLRVFIIAIVFTNLYMFLYSICGALLSLIVMTILKKFNFSIIIISITGAIFHNIGQLLVAIIFYGFNIIYYLPYLTLLAIITGIIIALITNSIIIRLPKRRSTYE